MYTFTFCFYIVRPVFKFVKKNRQKKADGGKNLRLPSLSNRLSLRDAIAKRPLSFGGASGPAYSGQSLPVPRSFGAEEGV